VTVQTSDVDGLLASHEVVVCCGPGGVGKTTTAAALATAAAVHLGGRVLVLTVDPARRLATALGLAAIGNEATQIDPALLAASTSRRGGPRGELHAAMLDTKASWDDLVRRHAPDRATAQRILANQMYRNVTGTFVQSHDYIAMERLYELHESGRYDLVVVDTPPTRNALDFLAAPERMADFFSSRLLRWLTTPARSRVLNTATRPFYSLADRILGSQFLTDISEFFLLFQSMYDGFVARARLVGQLLADSRTGFTVVSTLEPGPAREAEFFISSLRQRRLHLGLVVLNRTLPDVYLDPAASEVATRLVGDADAVAGQLVDGRRGAPDQTAVARVLAEVGASHQRLELVAHRDRDAAQRLGGMRTAVASVPELGDDIVDLAGLDRVASHLLGRR
jgi:anion-transporting  ArsA/GET3 family ATPase